MAKVKVMSIRKRLMIILLLWIALFVSFGIFAIKQMSNLGDVTMFIYSSPLQVSSAATEMRVDIIKIHRATQGLLLARNEAEQEGEMSKIIALDKAVLDNINIINKQHDSDENIKFGQDIKEKFLEWQIGRERFITLFKTGHIEEATYLTKDEFPKLVEDIEDRLKQVSMDSKEIASNLAKQSQDLERKQTFNLMIITIVLCIVFLVIFIITLQKIIDPINQLKHVMKESIHTGSLSLVNEEGDNEIIEMTRFYNDLAKKLTDTFWIKDNKNALNEKLSGYYSQKEITQKAINSLCRTIAAGNGAFYTYDKEDKLLKRVASYAFQQPNQMKETFALGEGIIGQVGLEKKALLLTDLVREESQVYTAIISEKPINTYVFPIVYEEELYGVIEVATLVTFEKLKIDYLEETSSVIARSLYSSVQNAKIVELLNRSERSKTKAYKSAEQLRKSNIELEEQHQLLQQQSAELQQTNAQLEEQQQQLEEQARTLSQQNKKLEKAKIDLEISGKYKSDFLANMSHELRTPLNSIILLSKLILDSKKETLNLPNQEKLEVIHKSGEELLRLINDVLDLSKVEAGAVIKDDGLFHSSQIIQDIKSMFENTAREKSLKLIIKDEVKQELYGDERKISQILRNFVSNAIKFTDKGFVKVELKYNPKISNEIIFSVKDSGRGILETQQELIFAQFQQEDNTISGKYGGTGLGLSISKKLAEVLGGYIQVKSKAGEGSEFILYVPDLIRSEKTITLVAEDKKEVLGSEEMQYNIYIRDKSVLNLTGKKILIVDDDPRNVYSLAALLEDYNADIIEAHNGRAALKKLNAEKVDLILMDINMPEMDGYETINRIRGDNRFKNIPIIVMTAKSLKEDRHKSIEIGANDYIEKPIDYKYFIKVIGQRISKN